MKVFHLSAAVIFFVSGVLLSFHQDKNQLISSKEYFTSTFSIVAYDPQIGDLGVAVQSKFPNVRPIVPWAEAGVGAIATQSLANTSYGPKGLALLRNGATAEEALKILLANDSLREERQVGIVDVKGNSATWTGKNCFDWAGGQAGNNLAGRSVVISGKYFTAQGNILVGKATIDAMVKTFESVKGSLSDRLVETLVAGGEAGGDRRGEQSAALLVVRKGAGYGGLDNFIDISIYDHPTPLAELQRLYEIHKLFFYKSDPKNLIEINETLCRELQTIMKNHGSYKGDVQGRFDEATKQSLKDFMYWENYDERVRDDNLIDKEVLADIRMNYQKWEKTHN